MRERNLHSASLAEDSDETGGAAGTGGGGLNPSAQITLRPIANPLPLGFLALAGGTLVLSGLQLGWISSSESHDVGLILIAFVFLLQLLTSVFSYLGRDVVAGTGMGILSGTWLSIGLVMLESPPGGTSDALGLLLLGSMAAMWVPAFVATGAKLVPAAVLGTAGLRFGVTAIYELTGSSVWKEAAGIVGLVLWVLAIYAALAMALEDSRLRTILPLLRRGNGRGAMDRGTGQLSNLEREAGVREQL